MAHSSGHSWIWCVTIFDMIGARNINVLAKDAPDALSAIGAWLAWDCEECPERIKDCAVIKLERICAVNWPRPR